MILASGNQQLAQVTARMDLEVRQLLVSPGPAHGALLPPREIFHPGNAEHVAAPLVAAEQGRRPHVEIDITGSNETEFVLVVGDCRREPGVHTALQDRRNPEADLHTGPV
jgi:hypothetical protein